MYALLIVTSVVSPISVKLCSEEIWSTAAANHWKHQLWWIRLLVYIFVGSEDFTLAVLLLNMPPITYEESREDSQLIPFCTVHDVLFLTVDGCRWASSESFQGIDFITKIKLKFLMQIIKLSLTSKSLYQIGLSFESNYSFPITVSV